VDAFRTGKSPEEAARVVEPHRQAIIERLVGAGMNGQAASAMADEQIQGELEKAQLPEAMNPWLSMGLSLAGAVGGYKLGKMGTAKMGTQSAVPASQTPATRPTSGDTAPPAAKPASAEPPTDAMSAGAGDDVYRANFRSPSADMAMRGGMDRVRGVPDGMRLTGPPPEVIKDAQVLGVRNGPFPSPSPRMDDDFAAPNMAGQVPGRGTRQFSMPASGPFSLGMSPELGNQYAADEMRRRMYRYGGG